MNEKELARGKQQYAITVAVREARKEERHHYLRLLASKKEAKDLIQSVVDTILEERRVSFVLFCTQCLLFALSNAQRLSAG